MSAPLSEARIRADERNVIAQTLVKLTRLDTEESDYSWIPLGEALVALDPEKRAVVLGEKRLWMHTDAIRRQAVRDFLADPATYERVAMWFHEFALRDGHYREPSFPDNCTPTLLAALADVGGETEQGGDR